MDISVCYDTAQVRKGDLLNATHAWLQQEMRTVSSPPHPDRLWGQPSILSNGYQGFFPQRGSHRG